MCKRFSKFCIVALTFLIINQCNIVVVYGAANGRTHSAMSGYKPLKEMLDSLFEPYEKRVRPFYRGSPVEVIVSVYIAELLHVDESNQEFTLDLFIREYWIEPRLTFIPKPNIGPVIYLDPEHSKYIWVPDTFVSNERKRLYYENTVMQEWIRLKSNGEVRRAIRRTLTASCPMTFYFYPFDRHLCVIQIESYNHHSEQIRYDWKGGSFATEYFNPGIALNATNGTVVPFRVMSLHANKYEVEFSSGNFSRLGVELILQKYWGVYLSKYYVPLGLLVIISLISLWMRNAKWSFVLNVINLIAFHLFLLIPDNGAKVPRTTYFKANDIYLYMSLAFLYLSFLVDLANLICSRYESEFEYREPKTYLKVEKELSPDEPIIRKDQSIYKGRSLERTQIHHQLQTIGVQTTFESAIEKILRICKILKWILTIGYILLSVIFWTLLVILSEAYFRPEQLVQVDFDS